MVRARSAGVEEGGQYEPGQGEVDGADAGHDGGGAGEGGVLDAAGRLVVTEFEFAADVDGCRVGQANGDLEDDVDELVDGGVGAARASGPKEPVIRAVTEKKPASEP